jgi:hypothetical protein
VALKTDIRDMVHEYPDYFVVSREKIREYSKAVKSTDAVNFDEKSAAEAGHPAIIAPLTFTACTRCWCSRTSSAPSTSVSRR